jgi:universal stress protein E
MRDPGRVIVGIDSHSASPAALQLGVQLARGLGSALECFVPVYNPHVSHAHFETREALQCARDRLVRHHLDHINGLVASLGSQVPIECQAAWDHPFEEALIRRVLEQGAGLLIAELGTEGEAAPRRLSSSQWQLVRHCPVPVLLSRGTPWRESPIVVAAVDPTGRHGRPGSLDTRILQLAELLARSVAGTVHAFHAWERSLRARIGERDELLLPDLPEGEMERRHREAVYAVLGAAAAAPARVAFAEGLPEITLPAYCQQHSVDLVVMGVIARNPFGRIFIGSTAERVLDRLPCDLLAVKPEGFRTPISRERWPREEAAGPPLGVPGI